MLFKKLYQIENFNLLRSEILTIVNSVEHQQNQIICQTLEEGVEDFSTGTGKIDELNEQDEKKYKFINPSLKNTYLHEIISRHNAYRTRILKLNPRSCYSIHSDISARIHIPIETNDQCWMIWPTISFCVKLQEGYAYWTDTRKPHTYLNGDKNLVRIHLVMVVE
jgi:hypothetical protein